METASLMTLEMPLVIPPVGESPGEEVQRKRWTREEYHQLGDQGWFRDQRTELIEGEIIVLPPQSHDHFRSIEVVRRILDRLLGENYWVRTQGPLPVDLHNEPEPDLSVVAGGPFDHEDHPRSSLLAIEVSRTTQNYDKKIKSAIYAAALVPEYWVCDLKARTVTVHLEPVADSSNPAKSYYSSVHIFQESQVIAPQFLPEAKIAVAELLRTKR
jgi:Uma2 family endonuclease